MDRLLIGVMQVMMLCALVLVGPQHALRQLVLRRRRSPPRVLFLWQQWLIRTPRARRLPARLPQQPVRRASSSSSASCCSTSTTLERVEEPRLCGAPAVRAAGVRARAVRRSTASRPSVSPCLGVLVALVPAAPGRAVVGAAAARQLRGAGGGTAQHRDRAPGGRAAPRRQPRHPRRQGLRRRRGAAGGARGAGRGRGVPRCTCCGAAA